MSKKETFQKIANDIMNIDHVGVQLDDIHKCEQKHQAILLVDKLDKHESIRLLFHVIHVQQLQLANATIVLDEKNPFKDMTNFDHIDHYISCNSPDMESLY